ncbi:unnamed protein product [Haemonchus placei]|uniref:IST1 homolog n=1 Tax=Haemonchus placei TaxID=6290 RepID=A0A0N4WUH3_HAEPC|nr:unnamed protein product [Haemonchus placei]
MLLMSRRKTINLLDSKKKPKPCESCRRSNSAKPKKNSLVIDKKPAVPPHGTNNVPSAPPQTLKNPTDESELMFPEPPSTFAGGSGNSGGGGGGTGGDLDFDELARRFDQLKKK